ncbi:hypothetical protein O3M35_005725 [Rhynocoris fuscipes]|uniref:EMI domain-containing protein n=1 Tax=Rhynocoris fuscipes TaxID=488301 RepID=A0AAW1DJM8_9HEMI
MRFYILAISSLLWIVTVQATPTGNHTCTGVVKHSVTVRVNVTEPVTYRTYTWCLKVPPRCSKYTVQLKDRVKIHTEMHNRTITVCCKGYVEMDYKCVPACPPQTECPNMHCNRTNHCYCTPGYQGLYCNYPCDRGFWGTDCKKTCDCPVGFTCHHLTGDCMIDDRPASKSRRTTTTTAATFSPETTNTEEIRTTASPYILTRPTDPPTLTTTLSSTTTTSMPTTSVPTTTIPTTQSTIPRSTHEATTTSTVSFIPTTPGLSVKIHIEEHNPQHRENNIPSTVTPTPELPSSPPTSTTEIEYDVTKKADFPEISSTTTLSSSKTKEETFPTIDLFGKHTNISEATLEATTTLAAVTESSVIPSTINITTKKEEIIPELTTTSPSPSTTMDSPSSKVTTFVQSVDVPPEVFTSSAVFTTSAPSADILPEVSTTSAVLTTSSSAGEMKEVFTTTTTTVEPVPETTSSRGSIPNIPNIIEELTSTTTANPATLPTTVIDQEEPASTLSTTQRTTPSNLYEVSTTSSTFTTTSELTSTTNALPTTHRTLDELTSASTTLPSTYRTLEKLNYTSEPRTLDGLTSTSSTLPTTLTTLDELTSSSGTPSSTKSTADEQINLSSTTMPSTLTTVNELTPSTTIEPTVQRTLEEMTSISVPKTTVESITTPSTMSATTPSTIPKTTSTPEYSVSNSVLSTPKPFSATTSFSSINYITLPSNEKTHETNPSSTVASTLSDKDKSTMSFNELNKTVDQYISLTTSTIQTVQPVLQTSVGTERLSSEEPPKNDNTTPNPYLSRKITESVSPITVSPDILPNLENNEMTTIKTTTIHPIEDAKIRKESDGINVNLEGSELMRTVETDKKSEVEGNEDLNIHEQITEVGSHPKVTLASLTEPEILTTTEPIRVTKETFDFDLDKLLAKTEIKNVPSSTIVSNSFHGTIYTDNDSITETTTYQGRDEETGKVSNIKKILLNDTNLISGINEVSTIFNREKLSDNEKLKQKPELVTTTLANKEETNSNLQQWITTNSRPAHTWYSHNKENQRKMKIKEDLKVTSHLDTQVNTERYDMSEESNVIDSMLTTFAEKGSRSNSVAPVFVNEETNIPSSYLNHGQMKYNLSSALAEEVQAGRNENSLFTLYSASTLISCIALILLVATSTAVWFCLRRRKEPTTLRRPCIMAYGTPNELSLNPLMYETVYPLESIEGEQCVDPDIFFCPTFTNNYAERINREFSELNYDHPRSSVCEPLYAEIHY